MPTAKQVVAVGASYNGYREKSSRKQLDQKLKNAGSKDYTIFAEKLHSYWARIKNPWAWCCIFQCYCVAEATGWDYAKTEKILCGSPQYSSNKMYRQFKAAGRAGLRQKWDPAVGDFLFCNTKKDARGQYRENTMGHTAIVIKLDSKYVWTREGNSSNRVQVHKMLRTSKRIYGYGRPRYEEDKVTKATASAMIDWASKQVGYHEKSGSSLKTNGSTNYTKYNKEMHSVQPSNMDYPAPWCDAFFDDGVYNVCGRDAKKARYVLCGDFDDYTVSSANLYKKANRWTTTSPKAGDQIFFKNSSGICHTGLVTKVSSSYVWTIEGNSSNRVAEHKYLRSSSNIAGYGHPRWDAEESAGTDTSSKASSSSESAKKSAWRKVVDLSSNNLVNGKLNSVSQKRYDEADAVIIKFTQGVDYPSTSNSYYKDSVTLLNQAKKDGKDLGVYHYANGGDPKKEAEFFWKRVKNHVTDETLLALDWEKYLGSKGDNPKWGSLTWGYEFGKALYEISGRICHLGYVQASEQKQLNAMKKLGTELWQANYTSSANGWSYGSYPSKWGTGAWDSWTIWQFTSSNNKCDLSMCKLSHDEWDALAKRKPTDLRTYQVTSKSGLYVRNGADTSYDKVDLKPCGCKFDSAKRKKDSQGRVWAYIEYSSGRYGWICLGKSGSWYVKRIK